MNERRKSLEDFVAVAGARVRGVTPDEIAGAVAAREVFVLDVREPFEWEAGHIPGSLLCPRGMLEFRADPTYPHADPQITGATAIVVVCAIGLRSAMAAATLRDMGYKDVVNLVGGVQAWEAAGHPLESG